MLVVLVVIIIIILLHGDVRQDRKGISEQSFLGFRFTRWLFMPLTSTIIIFSFLFFSFHALVRITQVAGLPWPHKMNWEMLLFSLFSGRVCVRWVLLSP